MVVLISKLVYYSDSECARHCTAGRRVEHSLMAQALLFTILSFLQRVQIRSWSPKGYNRVLMIRDSGGEVGAPSAESAHTVENRILG